MLPQQFFCSPAMVIVFCRDLHNLVPGLADASYAMLISFYVGIDNIDIHI
jgi:hypothetical protein